MKKIRPCIEKRLEPKCYLIGQISKDGNKKQFMECCMLPTRLYGAQTSSHTGKERKVVDVCNRKLERRI